MQHRISKRVASVPPSGIRKFFDIAATMQDVISLGIGEPDFVTPDVILQAGQASLRRGETRYTSNSGTIELRRAISQKTEALYGVRYDPEHEILVTVGVSEALYLALTALLDPGDEVIVPEPCFVAYTAEVVFAGGSPVTIATQFANDFQVTGAEIEAAITPRSKALLIGYPNNPTGAVLSRQRLEEIAQVAEKHDLVVLSDEIYDRLVYGEHRHVCFASLPGMRERTVHLGGFSKDYAMTGWRIGYACGPREVLEAMRKIHQYTIMSAPTMGQAAAVAAMTDPAGRGGGAGHGRQLRPPPPPDRRWAEQHRADHLRAAGRVLRLPQRRDQRHGRGQLRLDAAGGGEGGGGAGHGLRRGRQRSRARLLRHGLRADRRGAGADAALCAQAWVARWSATRSQDVQPSPS